MKLDPQFFLNRIEQMLTESQKQYEWATETLTGIRETIRKENRVTEKQRDAIMNIKRSV